MHDKRFKSLLAPGLLGLVLAVPSGSAHAQGLGPATISGRVLSDLGEPAIGAMVYIAEMRLEVRVTPDGRYTLDIPGDRVLGQRVFVRARGIGFRPSLTELALTPGPHQVNFTLGSDIHLLEEVIVTGTTAGTQKAKLPFSTEMLDASVMPVPALDVLAALQGKLPGANIVQASGRPGSAPTILMRGPKSINASGRSQEPLYVVDGVIIRGGLPDINPLDIERIEIAKGASASSLYGAQAGNGVIQIFTKSGTRASEGVRFHVRSEAGVSDIERDFGIARQHALVLDETGTRFCQFVSGQPLCARTFDYIETQIAVNSTPGVTVPTPPSMPVDPGSGTSGPVLRQRFQVDKWPHTTYNAVDVAVEPKAYTQQSVDMQGRVSNTSFFASASYLDQPGAIRFLNGYNRSSVRLNVDQQIGQDWQVGVRTYFSHSLADGLDQEGGGRSFFRLTRAPAIVNPLARDSLGRLFIRTNLQTGGLQNENPLYYLENQKRSDARDRIMGGTDVRYAPLDWLDVSGNFNFDISRGRAEQFRDKGFRDNFNSPATQNGYIYNNATGTDAINASVNLTTRHDIGDLSIRPNLRYFYEQVDNEWRTLEGNYLAVQGVKSASNATLNQTINSNFETTKQISVAGGLALDYKGRYILDGAVRRDGSSRFGAANRWDTYGRISGAWRIAQEPWWFVGPVSELKFRGSYGTAGNWPRFSAQYETFSVATGGVVSFGTMGNKNLRPEKMFELETGADLELLNRLLVTVTYAQNETRDQMWPVPVPAATGFGQQWQNIGTLQNKTWELSLDLPIVRTRDFSWSTKATYERTRTLVTELTIPPFNYGADLQATGTIFRLQEGERYGTFYGRYFLRSCVDLPNWTTNFPAMCGPGQAFQINDEGFVVWVGQGNSVGDGITRSLWETQLPGAQAPYGDALNWGMPIIKRDTVGGAASVVTLGNALPDYRFSITQDLQWKRLTLHGLLDAAIGQDIWNQGFHWAHLDFLSKDVDQVGKTVETAKPIGYYYRAAPPHATAGIGGLYDILAPSNFTVEDASYAKVREVLISFRVGRISGVGDWTLSLVGRNLYTFTDYRGFDPEVGVGGGQSNNAAVNAIDAFTFPNLRSVIVGVSTTF
ncbi:MAG TPA: SusC/RagA family TonB-linked outer membrane protein [Gemmatimonadales bacterium]|nr:SusC/RagA family TonB-linked outer membrane protein [Gemmatimonadales bacterium]